jgi:hypothetical protein
MDNLDTEIGDGVLVLGVVLKVLQLVLAGEV